jgi:hypothetical protein
MRRFLPLAIAITLFVALVGTAAFFWNDGWDDHRNGTEVVQVVPAAGTDATTGNSVVIVRDNHRPFFFPGFLFIPLFFFIIFFIARPFRGPRRWGGWNGNYSPGGNPPPWFDQWHRDAHAPRPGMNEPVPTPAASPSTTNDSDATPA